jgi:glycerophosphoryl diester phosphodiesterase
MTPTLLIVLTVAAPELVAHRGLAYHAPENTLPAYAAAFALRLGVEIDVRRTKDGKLVVMHDPSVDRTTDGKGKIEDLTLAELKKLDAGARFDPRWTGERVPTFDEALALMKARAPANAIILLDVKATGIEAELARQVAKSGLIGRVVFIGQALEPEVRRKLKAANGKLAVATAAPEAKDLARRRISARRWPSPTRTGC